LSNARDRDTTNMTRRLLFRLGMSVFALLLGTQSVWLLLSNMSRSSVDRLPTEKASATVAATQRGAARWAATIGAIRGDLWADLAFTYADLLWVGPDQTTGPGQRVTEAHASLDRALDNAPHNSSAWLLLAGLSLFYPSPDLDPIAPLKMSYYTGPSEQELIPLRLRITAHFNFLGDFELRQFVTRDLHLLLTQKQKSAVTAVYNDASPDGKRFIEHEVGEIDPSALDWLRSTAQPKEIPN
jgi:hypothetical protein